MNTLSKPTAELRFVKRSGLLILQQQWEWETLDGTVRGGEWRDVPVSDELTGKRLLEEA